MSKLTNAEKEKLDNTCGNLRVTKLGTHVKSLEDFVNEGVLATRADDVTGAINELYGMIVNNDCANIQIPPPGFFTLFGDDETGKLYVYYNDEEHPPVFRHVETPGELEGTLYLYIADPEGENHFEMEIGHYIAVRHLDNYYTKAEIDAGYAIKNHAVNADTYGLGTTGVYGHVKTVNGLTQSSHTNGLALSAYQGKVLKDAVDAKTVTVEKQSTAETGYSATYVVKQNNVQVGAKINIPKDFLVKSTSVKTCTTANQPVSGYEVGDIYIDWVINSKDNTSSDEHLYLRAKDLGSYPLDEVTLTIQNNKFSIKSGGVSSTQLASNAVTTAKIANSAVTNDKISSVAATKVADATAHANAINTAANATQAVINTAIDTAIKNVDDKCNDIVSGDIDLSSTHTHTKSQITDFPTSMAPTSHAHGNITNAGAIGSTANLPVITTTSGKLTTGSFGTAANTFCQGNDSRLSNARTPVFNNINPSSTATKNLNDYKTGGFYYISNDSVAQYVSNCPLSGTSNKSFFLLVETWGTTSTYVKQTLTYYNTNTTYTRTCTNNTWGAWVALIKEGDSRLSNARTPTSHVHGNITNDGKVGTNANIPLITGTNGVVQAGSFGTAANTFCQGNDSRLSNARTPTSHASTATTYGVSTAANYGHAMASSTTPKALGTAAVGSETGKFARGDHVHPLPAAATTSANGLMSSTDKTKLDGVATGATKNTVSNSLTDTSTTNALSAAQGKNLSDNASRIKLRFNSANSSTSWLGDPMNISIKTGSSLYCSVVNYAGAVMSGYVIFIVNGAPYSRSLTNGVAAITINHAAGSVDHVTAHYHNNGEFLASGFCKVTVTS